MLLTKPNSAWAYIKAMRTFHPFFKQDYAYVPMLMRTELAKTRIIYERLHF